MKQQHQEYKNLFKTFPELGKMFYFISHYMTMMNDAKTGCYFCYNMHMLLYNVSVFKRYLKASTKKVDNVLYYPFKVDAFPELKIKPVFVDFVSNKKIFEELQNFNTERLFKGVNQDFNYLKTEKLTKEEIITKLQHIENSLLVLTKAYQVYLKEYEQSFKK